MSQNKFVWSGLEELKADLRALPAELKGEGTGIVMGRATRAKAEIAAVYAAHRVSGELAKGLSLTIEAIGPFGTHATVRTRGNLAYLFDNGSEARHYITNRGNQHDTGEMWGKTAPTHVFVTTMMRARAEMYAELAAMLERHGLVVTGLAEAA